MHGFPVPGRAGKLARHAEDLGFDGLLLADSQNLVGDPFTELGVAAGVTGWGWAPGSSIWLPGTRP